ncbi:MAG: T9SS type A sorting domain-containing protein [Flavobacteriales bacterium]
MHKLLLITTGIFFFGLAQSQITETEPNDPFPAGNDLEEGITISGQTCTSDNPDRFRIILPADGKLVINTTASVPGEIVAAPFQFQLFSDQNNAWDQLYPLTGENGTFASDSYEWCCLLADTFYIEVYRGYAFEYCYDYTLSWGLIPATFTNDEEPNSAYIQALDLNYNTPMEGHLSFVNHPQAAGQDGIDFYRLVPPTNGTLRVFLESEAQSTGSTFTRMTLNNINGGPWYSQNSPVGEFQSPNSDTVIWDCVANDTIYIDLTTTNFWDRGYAYRIWFDMVAPVYANDIEDNDSFATAQEVDPSAPIEGNQYFWGDSGGWDYFKFYKPDTGYFKVVMRAETSTGDATLGHSLQLFDKNLSAIGGPFNGPLGIYSIPAVDSVTYNYLAADTFYIVTSSNYAFASCRSYQLDLSYVDNLNGVSNSVLSNVKVYPNPNNGAFFVEGIQNGNCTIDIYNSTGAKIHNEKIRNAGRNEINLENAPNGIYTVQISCDGVRRSERIVVVK